MAVAAKIVVLYSPAGGGHRSVAHAVGSAMIAERGDAQVEVLDVQRFAPSWFRYDLAWKALQLHGGHLWDWVFRRTDRGLPGQADRLRHQVNRIVLRRLARFLEDRQPDRVVCTHYLPAIAVSRLVQDRRLRAPLSIVVTDYVAHEAWIYPGVTDYFVPSPAVARSILRRGVHWNRVHITGIPIAPIMDEPPVALPHRVPLEVLGLTGGVPANLVYETIASIAPSPRLRLSIVAGPDETFRARLAELVRQRGLDAILHGRLPSLREILDRSHVVVTKAGGLVTTECLARGRAMVLPWPAFGQEHGNLMTILEVGAGLSASDHRDTGSVLDRLAAQPDRWQELGLRAQRAAIRGSARRVARYLAVFAAPLLVQGTPGAVHGALLASALLGAFGAVVAAVAVAGFRRFERGVSTPPRSRVWRWVFELGRSLSRLHDARVLVRAFTWSVLSELSDVGMLALALHALDVPVDPAACVLGYIAIDVSSAIPTTPGQVGVFEAATAWALTAMGVPAGQALACGLLYHVIHVAPALALGLPSLRLVRGRAG